MTVKDSLGYGLTGATAGSTADHEAALHQYRCYIGDPVASLDRALGKSPDLVMAHVGAPAHERARFCRRRWGPGK